MHYQGDRYNIAITFPNLFALSVLHGLDHCDIPSLISAKMENHDITRVAITVCMYFYILVTTNQIMKLKKIPFIIVSKLIKVFRNKFYKGNSRFVH